MRRLGLNRISGLKWNLSCERKYHNEDTNMKHSAEISRWLSISKNVASHYAGADGVNWQRSRQSSGTICTWSLTLTSWDFFFLLRISIPYILKNSLTTNANI